MLVLISILFMYFTQISMLLFLFMCMLCLVKQVESVCLIENVHRLHLLCADIKHVSKGEEKPHIYSKKNCWKNKIVAKH